MAEILHARVG